MTRKSTYTIHNGFTEDDDDDERGFLWWLGRIILVTFIFGIIAVGVAVMTLGEELVLGQMFPVLSSLSFRIQLNSVKQLTKKLTTYNYSYTKR